MRSTGDARVGVLRADLFAWSAVSEAGWCCVGGKDEGRDMGDASCADVDADMSGEGWSNSGSEAWLSLPLVLVLVGEGAVIKAI